jgi:hypothetical protein
LQATTSDKTANPMLDLIPMIMTAAFQKTSVWRPSVRFD